MRPPCPECGAAVERGPRAIYCSHHCAVIFGNRRICNEHRARIAAYKAERGCTSCGLVSPTYVLELHHLDPAKKWRAFGGSLTHRWDRLEAELEKCVVLCANHHRMVEAGDLVL